MNNKTAVLIHGCYLGIPNWDNIMLGVDQYGYRGRILRGIMVAYQVKAVRIYWGTGASRVGGVLEGTYILQYALSAVSEIARALRISLDEVYEFITTRSLVNTNTQNTREEITAVMECMKVQEVEKLIIVSSPSHVSRCVAEAEILRLGKFAEFEYEVFVTGSDVSYAGSSPKDVVIIEPEHRGDRYTSLDVTPLYVTARKLMKLSRRENGKAFLRALADFTESWWNQGD